MVVHAGVSRRSQLQASSSDRALALGSFLLKYSPFHSFFQIISSPSSPMTLIKMDSQSLVGSPAIAHPCELILELLRNFVNAAGGIKAFCTEVGTLQKFLDLIDRVFKAKLPRIAFEEQHFTTVQVLLDRCHTTLSRLCEILAASRLSPDESDSQAGLERLLRNMQSSEMIALRARIGFYIQILQMSLQTVNL